MAAPTIIPKSSYYDGVVTESDRAAGRAGAPDFTVYGADDLRLSAHPTIPFALVVKKGKASAFGVTAFVESSAGADLVVNCDPNTSGTRWDLITLRYDWRPELGGPTDIRAINAGGKQIPSNLENTPGRLVDQPTWLVRWTGNASAPAEYVDLRCFAGNGGMMANDTLALGYLKKPGATVRIGATLWVYQEVRNAQWDWRSYLMMQPPRSYTYDTVSNANGEVDFFFPSFPNGIVGPALFTDNTFGPSGMITYRNVETVNVDPARPGSGRVRYRTYDVGGVRRNAGHTVAITLFGH